LHQCHMKVVLIRHFKVGFKWKFFYNSAEYENDCGGYNSADVVSSPLIFESKDRLITSTMTRAMTSSKLIFKREPDLSDDALCEVPIKPFVKTKLRFPKMVWDIIGRLQWRLNLSPQPEPYKKSRERVEKFIDNLVSHGENVVIVCHGWVILLMIRKLRSMGFRGPNPLFIKNGVPYEFMKTS